MNKLNVLVLFGGRSPEHEISIITGIQVMNALNKNKYTVIPLYVTKDGEWVLGDGSYFKPETFKNLKKAIRNKPRVHISPDSQTLGLVSKSSLGTFLKSVPKGNLDVVFPTFHGRYGEDGTVQGLFELNGVAYVGCDVYASAVGMDKEFSKLVAERAGVPTLPGVVLTKRDWGENKKDCLQRVRKLKCPLFVKPARLGSTIGIGKASNDGELEDAIDVAFFYDTKVLIEKALTGAREINISVMGNNPYSLSACEEPMRSSDVLTFEDKYVDKKGTSKGMASAKRVLPAKIKKSTEAAIDRYALAFFEGLGGSGISRLDFLMSKDERKIYFNEVNTMPGSLAFYLWKEVGVSFDKLTDKLIDLAIARKKETRQIKTAFESNVLEGFGGVKGSKI